MFPIHKYQTIDSVIFNCITSAVSLACSNLQSKAEADNILDCTVFTCMVVCTNCQVSYVGPNVLTSKLLSLE